MANLVPAVRINKPDIPSELRDQYFPAVQEVSGPNGGAIPVDIGSVTLSVTADGVEIKNDIGNPIPTSVAIRTPTTTSVASSATSVTVLATNANRRGISIANDSTSALRLAYATPATAANAFIVMQPGSFLWLDQQLMITGIIYGIWESVNGTAQVTEYI